jgi:hypothetical protein
LGAHRIKLRYSYLDDREHMPKRAGKLQAVTLKLGKDPTLWRFDSLNDALAASTTLLGQLIKEGERLAKEDATEALYEEERFSAAGD